MGLCLLSRAYQPPLHALPTAACLTGWALSAGARSPRALYSATGRRFTPPPCETPQRVLELEATLMAFVRNKGKSTSRVGVQHQTSTNIKLQVSETENSTGVGLVAAASQAHLWSGAPVDPCTTAWFFGSVHSQRRCDRRRLLKHDLIVKDRQFVDDAAQNPSLQARACSRGSFVPCLSPRARGPKQSCSRLRALP